jgi:alpha-glucosidase (family GH31 glycosyl hydrolase)
MNPAVLVSLLALQAFDPVADPKAIVTVQSKFGGGSVRFTILTDALVRMEYTVTGPFEDRASTAFVNRRLPVPPSLKVLRPSNDSVVISTSLLRLTYNSSAAHTKSSCGFTKAGSDAVTKTRVEGITQPVPVKNQTECCKVCDDTPTCNAWVAIPTPACYLLSYASGTKPVSDRVTGGNFDQPVPHPGFPSSALSIEILGAAQRTTWNPGLIPAANLLGTSTSLDGITGSINLNCSAPDAAAGCTLGPISRDGWSLLDDSTSRVIDPSSQWVIDRNKKGAGTSDLYFFGHGLDFKQALKDYTLVAGPVPSVPRFALGVWWSRYWPYTAEELLEIAQGYSTRSIPIDVLVSDMAWHYHNETPVSWGGYAWSPQLFPAPTAFLEKLKTHKLTTVLNLHLNPVQHIVDEQAAAGGSSPGGYMRFAAQLGLGE